MSSVKVTGLDKLSKQLKKMEKGAEDLNKTKQVPFDELFPVSFMQKYTSFSSIDKLLESGGFNATSQEEFESIPDDEFDRHIATTTTFEHWEAMLSEATSQYVLNKLGF